MFIVTSFSQTFYTRALIHRGFWDYVCLCGLVIFCLVYSLYLFTEGISVNPLGTMQGGGGVGNGSSNIGGNKEEGDEQKHPLTISELIGAAPSVPRQPKQRPAYRV